MKIDDLIELLMIRFDGGGSCIDKENIGTVLLNLLEYLKEKENEK
jgi:hypothetical protein